MDVRTEATAVLRVQLEDLPQSPDADVLQVTVGQRLHVSVGLDHLLVFREVSPDEVAFTCGTRVEHQTQIPESGERPAILYKECTLTQDGLDHSIFQNLQGTRADKVVCLQSVSVAYEELPRCTERGLDLQGEGAQAPSACALKHGELQDVLVQVHGDVGSQFVREIVQELTRQSADKE